MCPPGAEKFHDDGKINEGTDRQGEVTDLIFVLQFHESDYKVNSAVNTEECFGTTNIL